MFPICRTPTYFLFWLVLLVVALSVGNVLVIGPDLPEATHGFDPDPRVRKPGVALKRPVGAVPVADLLGEVRRVGPTWELLQQTGETVRAFAIGDWSSVAGGGLTVGDFALVNPPDIVAALGLATVERPDTAGWFLQAGRRTLVKTTDRARNYPTYSYESLARVAWAVGITTGTTPSARVWSEGETLGLEELLDRVVAESPATGVWIVAAHVEFAYVQGQALCRSPAGGAAMSDSCDPTEPDRSYSIPQQTSDAPGLLVAVVIDPSVSLPQSDVAREVSRRFLSESDAVTPKGLRFRAHYALFRRPAPELLPGRPFQAIWEVHHKSPEFPLAKTLRRVLAGTSVSRANLSVWAVDSLGDYVGYPTPDLVDVLALDPTIASEQRWATDATFVGEAIYSRPRLLLRRAVAEAVVRAHQALATEGLRLKLFDAYRPLSVSQRLWRLKPEEGRQGYLANPALGSRHNRAAAVDCTLVDMAGVELEMPSDFLCFDERAHRTRLDMTPTARDNMGRLTRAMEAEGFTTIREEWWHFDAPNWRNYPVLDIPLWPEDEGDPGRERNGETSASGFFPSVGEKAFALPLDEAGGANDALPMGEADDANAPFSMGERSGASHDPNGEKNPSAPPALPAEVIDREFSEEPPLLAPRAERLDAERSSLLKEPVASPLDRVLAEAALAQPTSVHLRPAAVLIALLAGSLLFAALALHLIRSG